MTKSQPLQEFSELVLPKKMTKNEKSLSTRTGPTLQKEQLKYFDFLVKIYSGLTLRTVREEQLADQFRYLTFSSYLVIFRADQ